MTHHLQTKKISPVQNIMMIWLIWLAVLAGAVGQPLCDPQCHFTEQGPYTVDPALSICVSAEADELHDYIIMTGSGWHPS